MVFVHGLSPWLDYDDEALIYESSFFHTIIFIHCMTRLKTNNKNLGKSEVWNKEDEGCSSAEDPSATICDRIFLQDILGSHPVYAIEVSDLLKLSHCIDWALLISFQGFIYKIVL